MVRLNPSRALVIGESLVDVITPVGGSPTAHPGGSAANTAVALARLGRATSLLTSFGHDQHGVLIRRHLAAAGVQLEGNPTTLRRTSSARAEIRRDGSADYSFDVSWRVDSPQDLQPVVVHLTSIAALLAPGASVVRRLIERLPGSTIVSYDLNVRPAITGTGSAVIDAVEHTVGVSDVVKASEEDVHALYPRLDPLVGARRLLSMGPSAVVLTRGSAGAHWLTSGFELQVPAGAVTVVDTIGAGDTFAAALIDGMWSLGLLGSDGLDHLDGLEPHAAVGLLAHASRAAAISVSRLGADPPTRQELRGLDPDGQPHHQARRDST